MPKQKDCAAIVTNYEYGSAGCCTRIVYVAATMDQNDNETVITDPPLTGEETIAYTPGTSDADCYGGLSALNTEYKT